MPAYPGGIFGRSLTPQIPTGGPSTVLDATAQMPIGSTFLWNGAGYRYVKFDGGSGPANSVIGGPAFAVALTPAATATAQPIFTVTPDFTDSILGQTAVGVFLAVINGTTYDNYFICIQVSGLAQCIVPGGIAEDMVIGSGTDGQFGRIAAGSNLTRPLLGVRTSGASASGLSPVMLCNMDF